MLALKKSLLMLSILISLIIIIDYNVQGMIINGGRNGDDSNQISTTSMNNNSLKEYNTAIRGNKASWLTCQICSMAVGVIRLYPNLPTVQAIFVSVCSLGYEESRVCEGLSQLFGEELIYVLVHSSLQNSEICGLVIGTSCMSTSALYPHSDKWKLPLLPLSNYVTNVLLDLEHRQKWREENAVSVQQTNQSTILHLSDLHLDIYYQPNAPAGCSEPLCCRSTSTSNKRSHAAGFWGSMDNCDSVLRTVENLLTTISQQHSDKYRYLLLTGDYIPHDIWNTTKEEIIHTTRTFNGLIKKHVPNDKIIIPVIGNHESNPVDQFCPEDLNKHFSSQWLYEELLQQWKQWIPAEYHEIFRQYGYYAVVDRQARFIVMNMNYCARLNFWNVLRYLDMGDMLHWLQLELQNATLSGQYVYLVGHIAPDEDECFTHWVITYRDIIERYKNIIRGQFFGHTHLDEIRLYYSNQPLNNPEPIGVAYLAPSVTTYLNVMPSFRFYSTDTETGELVDHMTYYLNLTKANHMDKHKYEPIETTPVWEFEYNARDSYNMTSLSPKSWHQFTEQVLTNPIYLRRYYQHYGRYNDDQTDMKPISSMINVIDKVFVRV
ncbi:sphingomyelin phosphodiesterase-like isoform X2 [Dermatophagoides pteronyssinus]|uniref:sphingomyelin phosphodiesterase-like isoform X2 n=1 Tax=Dermatophagoides pteronyssinus TaxID=6956 RepID=UPI003F663221